MAEEGQEKKKTGIVRRILKWIGLGLLTFLLIIALIFQAPWKVITVLVIVLLACTLLPRPARKWFWCAVGVVVMVLVVWVFLPDSDSGDWRPYMFDEELAALEAKRSIPDSENAARFYNDLLEEEKKYEEPPLNEKMAELMEKGEATIPLEDVNDWLAGSYSTFYPEFWNDKLDKLTREEFWSSVEYPQIAKWLQKHESTITTLIEASRKNKCRFPIAADIWSYGKLMGRLPSMRRWTYLLTCAANNDLGDGRIDQAVEKNLAILQMAKHQYQQPAIIDKLVGIAIEALAVKQLNKFVITDNPTDAHLTIIEETLTEIKHDWNCDLLGMLDCEKLMSKNVWAMYYETNDKGKIRLTRDVTAAMRARSPQDFPSLTYWRKKLMRADTILQWFYMPATPQKCAEIIDAGFKKLYTMTEPGFDWQKEPEDVSITSLFSALARFNWLRQTELSASTAKVIYYRIHDMYVRTIAEQRGSRIIISLRRYKNKNSHWPEGLDDIRSLTPAEIFVDPFNNGTFVYKLTDDSFMLYSKGKNNIDENGEYVSDWPENKPDDWLIWPKKSRRAEEVNKNDEQ